MCYCFERLGYKEHKAIQQEKKNEYEEYISWMSKIKR